MKTKKVLYLLFLIFVLPLTSSIAMAGFHITPSISVRQEYNDNIYLTPNNEEDAFITTIIPAVNLTYEASRFTLSLDYSLHFKFYSNNSNLNETSLSRVQRVHLDSMVNIYREIVFIHITDDYRRVPIDDRSNTAVDNELTNMTDSNTFVFNPYILYPLTATLQVRADYIYENIWYKHKSGDDTENHTLSVDLIKEFTPTLKGELSFSYLMHRPDLTEEYDRQSIEGTLEFEASQDLTITGGMGYTWFDFDMSPDSDESFWNVGAEYKLSEALALASNYTVYFVDSVRNGTYKSRTLEGSLTYSKFITTKITLRKSKSEYLNSSRLDKSRGIDVDFSMPLTDRLTCSAAGSYTYFKFYPEGRKDKRYSARVSVDYEMRIATLSFGYTFNKNNSTDNTYDYDNNIVWVHARLSIP